jgi:dienelactone hydrolase
MKWFAVAGWAWLLITPAAAQVSPAAISAYSARDTLTPQADELADANACLDGLVWKPVEFEVTIEPGSDPAMQGLVRFPSPKPNGVELNDRVALEWYAAKDDSGKVIDAPAIVVVHESGSKMEVGRLFAKAFHAQRLHAFLIQLPFYGARKPPGFKPDGRHIEPTMKQGIADVRRARDAVAALPHIDSTNIAVQGTSLGGFVAATTGGLDRGFTSVHIMVAGGDLYGLVSNGQREAGKLREMLAEAGYTGDKLRDLFAAIEPLRLAHRLNPQTTWLYSATRDQVVPPSHALKLAEAAKLVDDHHIRLWADHYTGIVYVPVVVDSIAKHVKATNGSRQP